MSYTENFPPSLKAVQSYVVRARDFSARSPLVAHVCLQYAMKKGIEVLQTLPKEEQDGAKKYLMGLMDTLEKERPAMGTSDEQKRQVLNTAMLMFKRADDAERSGKADKALVQMFVTAATLMETTKYFAEMDPHLQEKQAYARQVAARMKRALDAGEAYVPMNPPEDTAAEEAEINALLASVPGSDAPEASPGVPEGRGAGGSGAGSDSGSQVAPAVAAAFSGPTPPPPPPADIFAPIPQTASTDSAVSPEYAQEEEDDIMRRLEGLRHKDPSPPQPSLDVNGLPTGVQPGQPDYALVHRAQQLQEENTRLRAEAAAMAANADKERREMENMKQQLRLLEQQLRASASGQGAAGAWTPVPGFSPDLNAIADAQKFAKFAVSALQFKDISNARENLTKSMSKINGHG